MLTKEQIELRKQGITATDVAAIVGVHPYRSALDVLLDKQGKAPEFVETDRVRWGNILEGPIRQDYAERHGVQVVEVGTLVHPGEPWAMATPDGVVYLPGGPSIRGWECKTHTAWLSSGYGEALTDEVPAHELIQCAWNLHVARAVYGEQIDRWDLTAFVDGLPTDYIISHDPDLEQMLVEAARNFHQVHVIGGADLPPDGSAGYTEHLKRRFPRDRRDLVQGAPEVVRAAELLREARQEIAALEREEERLEQVIKEAIGDAKGVIIGSGKSDKITWTKNKDGSRINWQGAFNALREATVGRTADPDGLVTNILNRNTETVPGPRVFRTPRTWAK